MAGLRFAIAAVFFMAGLTLLSGLFPARAAQFPAISAPVYYTGTHEHEHGAYLVFLYLAENQGFFMREVAELSNGKSSRWEQSGTWHQVRDRAFLQLSNKDTPPRLLNVGGGGLLYMSVKLPFGEQVLLSLRPKTFAPPEFTLNGFLRVTAEEVFLEDAASGLEYLVLPGDPAAEFLREYAPDEHMRLPVRATVSMAKDASMHVVAIEKTAEDKKGSPSDRAHFFLEAVKESGWRISLTNKDAPRAVYLIEFLREGQDYGGRLEFFDGMRHRAGRFSVKDEQLELSVDDEEDPQGKMDPYLEDLLRSVRFWRLAGDVIELWGDAGMLAVLEKVRFGR